MKLVPMVTLVMSEVPHPAEMDIYLTSTQIQSSQLDVYLGDLGIEQICPTISMKEEEGDCKGWWKKDDPWQEEKVSLRNKEDEREDELNVLDSSSTCSSDGTGEPLKNKQKPAPLDLPSDPHFTLTPPYTGTPRYLWTPTKTTNLPPSTFFSPEPKKIRIGEEFQAVIPDLVSYADRKEGKDPDTNHHTPVYTPPADPLETERRENFFKFALPVYPDTEYLHHCVHLSGGNLDEAGKLARCPVQPKLPTTSPLHNYRYNGRWRWTLDDQERFLLLFQRFGRNLAQIAKWMPDKKMADIIEYYYYWKMRYPEVYKQWRNSYRIVQQPLTEYEQKPVAKTSRARNRKEIVYFETEAYTTHDSKGNKEIKFRQKKVVNPYSVSSPRNRNKPPNPQPLGSYKCKVCGKEFQKVKSRSAHMKTHKRQQNAAAALNTPTTTLLQQQYHLNPAQQQQLQQHLQQQLKNLSSENIPPVTSSSPLDLLLPSPRDTEHLMTSQAGAPRGDVTSRDSQNRTDNNSAT